MTIVIIEPKVVMIGRDCSGGEQLAESTDPVHRAPPDAKATRFLGRVGKACLWLVYGCVFLAAMGWRVVWPVLRELGCIAIASIGCTVGRALVSLGAAASRKSLLIQFGADAATTARLPVTTTSVSRVLAVRGHDG